MFISIERRIKYFLIQSTGSLIFLFSLKTNIIYSDEMFKIYSIVPPIALILKSGIAPLHSWTPEIIRKFNFLRLFLFTTLQKLGPLLIIFSSWTSVVTWILVLNVIVGGIGGVTQSSFAKLIIFSSINNSGWILLALLQSIFTFWIYFFVYTLITWLILDVVKKNQIKWIVQIKSISKYQTQIITILILSIRGLPPFVGFIPKWMVLNNSILIFPLGVIIGFSIALLTIFFYIKCVISLGTLSFSNTKWMTLNNKNKFNWIILIILSSPLYFTLT